MISRVEGSHIIGFDQKEFDEYRLVRGTVAGYGDASTSPRRWGDLADALNDENSIRLEGEVWKLTYQTPDHRSTLEIIRSYQAALTEAGFDVLYQCNDRECAGPLPRNVAGDWVAVAISLEQAETTWFGALPRLLMQRAGFSLSGSYDEDQRYLAAHLARDDADIYVSVLALGLDEPIARVDVIEVESMASNLVAVNAATMAADIEARGSVALYGIYFDTNRADVKPESRPTLAEIAKLLEQNRSLELIVVGHTDNQGTLDHNLDLSLRRARAVVSALVSDFGVAAERLDARGVGFLAPVAPNTSEEGRAKNRRVQLTQR